MILEDLFVTISCSLQGIEEADWAEEAAKGVKLLGLVEQSSLGDNTPPSNRICGSAGGLSLNAQGPNIGCTGIFAESVGRPVPAGPRGEPNTNIGGKVTGRPEGDVT